MKPLGLPTHRDQAKAFRAGSWVERLLMFLFRWKDITKPIPHACPLCEGSQFIPGIVDEEPGQPPALRPCPCTYDKNDAGPGMIMMQSLYLRRFYVWEKRWCPFRIFIHKIARSDDDPDPHDHPWNFLSLILKGGYVDQSYAFTTLDGDPGAMFTRRHRGTDTDFEWKTVDPLDKTGNITPWHHEVEGKRGGYTIMEPVPAGSIVYRPATHIHRVILAGDQPSWSLVFGGRTRRAWGFVKEGMWVFWRKYLNNWSDDHA